MIERYKQWMFSGLCLVSVTIFLLWSWFGNNFSAHQSTLHPLAVLQHILNQLGGADSIVEWNFPVWSIIVTALWLAGTCGTGWQIVNLCYNDKVSGTAFKTVVSAGIGFVVFGVLQFVIGVLGFARIPLIPLMAVIGIVVVWKKRIEFFGVLKAILWRYRQLPRTGQVLALLGVFEVFLTAMPALVPPIQSDGMRYHLGAVQEYLKQGRIVYLPSNAYSNMPLLVEMHFMAALACNAPEASQLMHLVMSLLTTCAIYACSRKLSPSISPQFAILSAAVYYFTPMCAILAGWPFTDHGISFLLLVSIATICQAIEFQSWRSWLLLGLAAGGLIGTKYTMGPVGVVIALLPVALCRSCRNFKGTIIAISVMAVVGGIWYLKNFFYTGNPFYPLATQWFPGGEWTKDCDAFLKEKAGNKGIGIGLWQLFAWPIMATFQWIDFEAQNPGPTILISVLTVTGFTLFTKKDNRLSLGLIAIFLLIVVIWFISYQSNRLLLPVIALGLTLFPGAFLRQMSVFPQRIITTAFIISIVYGALWAVQWSWVATPLSPPPLPYLLGAQNSKTFRYKSLSYARAFDYLNDHVPADEKVLLIGEHRIFGADFNAVWSDWFDTPILAQIIRKEKLTSMDDLYSYLKAANIRWILINQAELQPQLVDFKSRFTENEWAFFENLTVLKTENEIVIRTMPPGVKIIQLDGNR